MQDKKIGLIGVGMMGHGIALNIAKKGHALTVLEHPGNQPIEDLRALGVRTQAGVAALAAEVDVLLLCVTVLAVRSMAAAHARFARAALGPRLPRTSGAQAAAAT